MTNTTLAAQLETVTSAAGLLDRSERGRLALSGSQAKELLSGQVTNDVESLLPGEGCYAAFLTHKGKMLGDLRVLDTGAELLLDTERVSLQALFNQLRRAAIGFDAELHKRTLESAQLSLLGPRSREVVGVLDLPEREHTNVAAVISGHPVRVIATDLGVDVICESPHAGDVRVALIASGAREVSAGAAESLRVRSGRPRYGVDVDESTIPQEAGINERAVSFTKGCYVGQETVARLHYKGRPTRHLRGLRLNAPAAHGDIVMLGEREVGRVGTVDGGFALALLRREAEPGQAVAVGDDRSPAMVAELPFA